MKRWLDGLWCFLMHPRIYEPSDRFDYPVMIATCPIHNRSWLDVPPR